MTTDNDMLSLVGFGCESFLYGSFIACTSETKLIAHSSLGCYTILFAMFVYLKLNSPDRTNSVKGLLFIMSVLLYLSSSGHFALEFFHFNQALVCAIPYLSHAISEYHSRVPQVSRDSRIIIQAPSLAPVSSSHSQVSSVILSFCTAVGCCGARIIGSSLFQAFL
jgi:hypothetical protein